MYGRTFIFVENFHVNNLSEPRTFPDLRYFNLHCNSLAIASYLYT